MRGCLLAVALLIGGCSSESFEIATPDAVAADDGVDTALADPDTAPIAEDAGPESEADADANADADADADASTDAPAEASADASDDADASSCDATVLCFTDLDGDGFAAAGSVGVAYCACPKGTTPKSPVVTVDCNDEDPRVRPGTTAWYQDPYCVPGTACAVKSFDYNCNGTEERQFAVFTSCASGCVGIGLTAATDCGLEATLTQCKTELICKQVTSSTKQGCH